MNPRVVCSIFCFAFLLLLISSASWAGFIDFEDGVDGDVISSTIEGMEFTTTEGYDWVYGDWSTGEYNGPYLAGGIYYSEGNFFAWLGVEQGTGIITFTDAYATFVEIGYSSYSDFYLEAYDLAGNLLDSTSGQANTDTGQLDLLRVDAPGMAYVMMHDTGNYWLVDNLFTDAIMQCKCDDHCQDNNFCTGEKVCDLEIERCQIQGDPCGEGFTCNEETDSCEEDLVTDDDDVDDDDIPEDDDDDIPEDDDDSFDSDDDKEPADNDDNADDDDDSEGAGCCG